MKIDDIEKYYQIFDRLVDLFPVVESALEDGGTSTEFEDFMSEELYNLYSTNDELKENIDNVVVSKKDFVKLIFQIKKLVLYILCLLNLLKQIKLKVFLCQNIL